MEHTAFYALPDLILFHNDNYDTISVNDLILFHNDKDCLINKYVSIYFLKF